MKKILLFTLLIITALPVFAGDDLWTDNYTSAKERSAEEGKYMFLFFTGSDWCGWCVKLKNEVLLKDAFLEYAKGNLVLMVADFPRSTPIEPKVKEQNRKLASDYGIKGYPTVIILNPAGEEVQRTGYRQGGAEAYVNHLKAIIQNDQNTQS